MTEAGIGLNDVHPGCYDDTGLDLEDRQAEKRELGGGHPDIHEAQVPLSVPGSETVRLSEWLMGPIDLWEDGH